MKKHITVWIGLFLSTWTFISSAANCPDPQTSSLLYGVIPDPWQKNPFSSNSPQGEEKTRFSRAQILVANGYGVGLLCAYKSPGGEYSIWWEVPTKIPAAVDNNWVKVPGGYRCTQGLSECQFYTAG